MCVVDVYESCVFAAVIYFFTLIPGSCFDTCCGTNEQQLESLSRCLASDADCTTWVNEEGKATDRKDDMKETKGYRTAFVCRYRVVPC